MATVGSWRDVFAGEAVIMVLLLGASAIIRDAPLGRQPPPPRRGRWGALRGRARAGRPRDRPELDLGLVGPEGSPDARRRRGSNRSVALRRLPFLVVAGLLGVAAFAIWERRVAARGGDTLVDLAMLRSAQLRAGLGARRLLHRDGRLAPLDPGGAPGS